MPKVSVLICAHNSQKYFRQTIDSVVAQTFHDWELVIVDDGSTDGTRVIAEEYQSRGYSIKYHYQTNQGLGYSRNKGIQLAQGEWIALIDHDDLCEPQRLEVQCAAANQGPRIGLVFANSNHFTDDGTILRRQFDLFNVERFALARGQAAESLLLHGCFIDSGTVFFRRDLALAAGGFPARYRYVSDYDFFIKLGQMCDFGMIDQVLSHWRVHASQLTRAALETNLREHIQLYRHWSGDPHLGNMARHVALMKSWVSDWRLAGHLMRQGRFQSAIASLARSARGISPRSIEWSWLYDQAWRRRGHRNLWKRQIA